MRSKPKTKPKPKRKRTETYRIDRPPTRLYVTVDELGPHTARARKADAEHEAEHEKHLFGASHIYEYRLVDSRPRHSVAAPQVSEEKKP